MRKGVVLVVCLCLLFTAYGHAQAESLETITIKGNVIFPQWEQGAIFIDAFDGPDPRVSDEVAWTSIDKPGEYVLEFEGKIGDIVYIYGYNDSADDGPPIEDEDVRLIHQGFGESSVLIETAVVEGIDLIKIKDFMF
ncbi:MAG: hypothetical protein K9M01_05045 [Candidatus Omnitrophica bacterium]|nr:hypothetical protein [Candidatus Omnitrophota bacterium]